jgi:hypothetical protein
MMPTLIGDALPSWKRARANQALMTTLSNVLATASTAVVVVGISATASLEAVAYLTLALVPLTVSLGVQRTALVQTFLASSERVSRASAATAAFCLTTISCATTSIIVWVSTLPIEYWLVVAIVALAHAGDFLRYTWFQRGCAQRAVAGDSVALVSLLAGVAVASVGFGRSSVLAVLVSWIIGLALSSILNWPRGVGGGGPPTRSAVTFVGSVTVETAVTLGVAQILTLGLALITSSYELGSFRLAQMAVAPIAIISLSALTRAVIGGTSRVKAVVLALIVMSGVGALLIIRNPVDILSALGLVGGAGFAATFFVCGVAAALSTANYVKMVEIRRRFNFGHWIAWRTTLCSMEPILGLLLARPLGALGAALGLLAHQATLAIWLVRAHRSSGSASRSRGHSHTSTDPTACDDS